MCDADWFFKVKCWKIFMMCANNNTLRFMKILVKSHYLLIKWVLQVQILKKLTFDDDNYFYENDPDTIIHARLLAQHNKFEKGKSLKNR